MEKNCLNGWKLFKVMESCCNGLQMIIIFQKLTYLLAVWIIHMVKYMFFSGKGEWRL